MLLDGFVLHIFSKNLLHHNDKRSSDCLNLGNVCYAYESRMLHTLKTKEKINSKTST